MLQAQVPCQTYGAVNSSYPNIMHEKYPIPSSESRLALSHFTEARLDHSSTDFPIKKTP